MYVKSSVVLKLHQINLYFGNACDVIPAMLVDLNKRYNLGFLMKIDAHHLLYG